MRILLTADPELPVPPTLYGGIERIIASLGAGLLTRGHEVALVAHPESDPKTGWQLFPWPGGRSQHMGDTWANLRALSRAVDEFRPDVVHSFSRLFYLGALLWNRHLPKIMSYQREPSGRTVRWAARLAGDSLTFTGCSEHIAAQGRQRGGGRWETVHNFVDLASYDFSPTVPDDAPLVFLSRIERIKGAHTAIAACRRAGRRLLLAGNHADEGEHGRYWQEEIVPHLGHDGVEYVGPVDDAQKNQLLGQAAAMIVPIGWDEPFGIVFAEALACGTPVISCPRGALPEIIRSGVDGFLVRDAEEAAKVIARLPDLRRANCRARAENHFSKDVIVTQYETLYRRVTALST